MARELDWDWHTVNDAVVGYGAALVDDPDRIEAAGEAARLVGPQAGAGQKLHDEAVSRVGGGPGSG